MHRHFEKMILLVDNLCPFLIRSMDLWRNY